ncbi:MAG TPA: oxidoreductase [Steroidobacter sp.]|uniref:oxidoreductase n=1 Tax=Steroidobacter sp. TaxID=1978227 RepID=UPI002ED90DFF
MPSEQRPIPSGFSARSTAEEVLEGLDLRDRLMVVTGGYSGLGRETVRVLVNAGAKVIVPARDINKAARALAAVPGAHIDELDLMDPASIDAFAERFLRKHSRLQVLINCAGIMASPLIRDGRGYESQFSTNHLGHFQLAVRLWPALRRAGEARIVALSSRAHRYSAVDFDDPNFNMRPYDRWQAYGQSKTANSLFAVAADKRGEGCGVRAFSVHPGGVITELSRHMSEEDFAGFGLTRDTPQGYVPPGQSAAEGGIFKSIEQGAATAVWCATSPQLRGHGGVYCEDADISVISDVSGTKDPGVNPWAIDPVAAERLWQMSEMLTEVRLD